MLNCQSFNYFDKLIIKIVLFLISKISEVPLYLVGNVEEDELSTLPPPQETITQNVWICTKMSH